MSFRIVPQPSANPARCPFRIVETTGREVDWVNRYLDMECLRRLAPLTVRSGDWNVRTLPGQIVPGCVQ
jgi:hypothetical protein